MSTWTTIILLTLTLSAFGQTKVDKTSISKSTNSIVKKIEKVNVVMSSAVGYEGARTAQYDNFIKLKKNATTSELIDLTNHRNPTVRCYAFWALAENHAVDLYPIILNHINDNELVETLFGCIGGIERVGDFFINVVTNWYTSTKLDLAQFAMLDSILIYTSNDLSAKSAAIRRIGLIEPHYAQIRELVIRNNDQAALVALAKYQKEQDIGLIFNNRADDHLDEDGFFHTYEAISYFPHPQFLPLLEKNLLETLDNDHYSSEWRKLYKAIASYKNDKAVELLQIPFTQVKNSDIRQYHIDFVFSAIEVFKAPIFDDLLWTLWAEEDRINLNVFEYLSNIDTEKAFQLAKWSLQRVDMVYAANLTINFYDDIYTSEPLFTTMLNLTLKREKDLGLKIIRDNIKNIHVHLFPIFSTKAAELKDPSLIEPLFGRLETESNAHIYLKATAALIAYKDASINRRILETRKKNKHLNEGWGSVELDKLLESNNIK